MIPGFILHNLDENMDGNLNEDLDENLAWLTQKTEDPKSNKGNLTFTTHTVNVIELNFKVIKKWQPPVPISTSTPFSGLFPLSSKKFCTPSKKIPTMIAGAKILRKAITWVKLNLNH